jgi:cytochrome P450
VRDGVRRSHRLRVRQGEITVPRATEETVHQLFETPEGRRAPYPLYHELRAQTPVHYSEPMGLWLVSTYEGVSAILRDPRFGKNFPQQMESTIGPGWQDHSSASRLQN